MILVIVWPVRYNWARKPVDSFPLSYYPMFSHDRHGKAEMTYLLGVSADGKRRYLPYQLAGTGGMNQVRKVIAKRAKKDPTGLCKTVADAIASGERDLNDVQTVKIIRGQFSFDQFFSGDQTPKSSNVLCSCFVNRDAIAHK